ALEPTQGIVARADFVVVGDVLEELADGSVERRGFEVGRQVRERPETEGARREGQVAGVEGGGDADPPAAVQEDAAVAGPGSEPREPLERVTEQRQAIAEVRAEAEERARHQRRRTSSTAGVPTSPWSGGVSFRTRTRTSCAGNSRRSASTMRPARRSMRLTRWPVPISTMRRATAP